MSYLFFGVYACTLHICKSLKKKKHFFYDKENNNSNNNDDDDGVGSIELCDTRRQFSQMKSKEEHFPRY